jgi:predicted nuclease of restriction endonuclease-like (RecB) superfamily
MSKRIIAHTEPREYGTVLADLKSRIVQARISASRAVNRELISLYWDIGQVILQKQKEADWGDSVVERLAGDLRQTFPDMGGFSTANIWRIRQLFQTFSRPVFLAQAARELPLPTGSKKNSVILAQAVRELITTIPWGHLVLLMGRLDDPCIQLFYLRSVARFGWTRSVLLNQLKSGAYERTIREPKSHNFPTALPEHFAEQASEMMKSRYNLGFIGIAKVVKERELEDRLITNLQHFLLELGYGFCFVGRQHKIVLGRKEYFVDLLFYHRHLKALVAFELKVGAFEPEHAGQMDFYLNLLNEKERGEGDQPSIGIILCAEKDDIEVEFALKSKTNPIGVAEYQLSPKLPATFKGRLPTASQLATVVRQTLEAKPAEIGKQGKNV